MNYQLFNVRNNGFLASTLRVKSKTPVDVTAGRLQKLLIKVSKQYVTVHPVLMSTGDPYAVDLFNRRVG